MYNNTVCTVPLQIYKNHPVDTTRRAHYARQKGQDQKGKFIKMKIGNNNCMFGQY